jgi:hypothetical protein
MTVRLEMQGTICLGSLRPSAAAGVQQQHQKQQSGLLQPWLLLRLVKCCCLWLHCPCCLQHQDALPSGTAQGTTTARQQQMLRLHPCQQ